MGENENDIAVVSGAQSYYLVELFSPPAQDPYFYSMKGNDEPDDFRS